MCVVSLDNGGLGGVWMVVVDDIHTGQIQGGWSHVERCSTIFSARGDTLLTPLSTYGALGRVELELADLTGMALTRDVTRNLRFVVHAAGWLHTIVLHAHCCC